MPGIVIALIVIFAVVAIVFLALAAYHFAAAKKESPAEPEPEREDIRPVAEPAPVKIEKREEKTDVDKIVERASHRKEDVKPAPAEPAPAPAPESGLAAELEKELDPDGQYVILQQSERLTLREEYAALPKNKKRLFDKVLEEMTALEKARVKEAKYSITAMQ